MYNITKRIAECFFGYFFLTFPVHVTLTEDERGKPAHRRDDDRRLFDGEAVDVERDEHRRDESGDRRPELAAA